MANQNLRFNKNSSLDQTISATGGRATRKMTPEHRLEGIQL
jgi:hypothetical protein